MTDFELLDLLSTRLHESAEKVTRTMQARVAGGDPDADQAAVSELAWTAARAEAATATAEWARSTGDRLALKVAEATLRDAQAYIDGAPVEQRVNEAARLVDIAKDYRPLEELGAGDEQRLLRRTFRDFATREILPRAADIHRQNLDVPEPILKGLAELGAFGLSIPAQYGGLQSEAGEFETMLIVTEELSRASMAAGGSLATRPEILVRALLRGGTEEQRERWLPVIASGKKLVSIATTEPDFGSDVAGLKCRAERSEGGWLVNGNKLWCTFAGRAELMMVLLRTADLGHRGLSVFVVEKPAFAGDHFQFKQPGGGALSGRAIPTIGYRGMHTFELSFENILIPEDGLVGGHAGLNRGFYLQMESFAMGRLQTAGRAVGLMQKALEDALAYAQQRIVFAKPVAAMQLPAAMLGRMVMRVASARQLSYRAARLMQAGGGQMEASLAKLYASRMAEEVTRDAGQVYGGMGYAEETDVSRYFLDARVLSIFEGAEEVLALRVIGKALLG